MERGRIPQREEVVRCGAVAAVGVTHVAAPGVLAPVGLEAVDADFVDEVAALVHPPSPRVVVRPIGEERAAEPPAAVAVRPAAVGLDGVAALDHDLAIDPRLDFRRSGGLQQRHLPEQHPEAALVQLIDGSKIQSGGSFGGPVRSRNCRRTSYGAPLNRWTVSDAGRSRANSTSTHKRSGSVAPTSNQTRREVAT